jgi:hypothetical protein
MTCLAEVDGLSFVFPAGWELLKYDTSSFHRNQFQKFSGGTKAVDLVAVAPGSRELWLIEAKDYRHHRRSKPGSVFKEMAAKVLGTLAGLATARVRANDANERGFAAAAMQAPQIRIALHLNQPTKPSRLFPHVVDPATASISLKKAVRVVDPHPILYGSGVAMPALPWSIG